MFRRLWVPIPAPYTGWTWHFSHWFVVKNCIVCSKRLKINEKEARFGPFFKKYRQMIALTFFLFLLFLFSILLFFLWQLLLFLFSPHSSPLQCSLHIFCSTPAIGRSALRLVPTTAILLWSATNAVHWN